MSVLLFYDFIIFKNFCSVRAIRPNGITLSNHLTEMTHNEFSTLSPPWMTLKANSRVRLTSNTFHQPMQEVSFEGSDKFCSFEDNIIHQVNNKALHTIYENCLIENTFFDLPCECEMKGFPTLHNDQSKCTVSALENFICFSDKYVRIDEYLTASCKDNTHVAWSECGTKINAMLIGVSVGIVLVVGNICFCYFAKCRKGKGSKRFWGRKRADRNNYKFTEAPEAVEPKNFTQHESPCLDRKSGEIILDGLGDRFGKIKVTSKVTQQMSLVELPNTFRGRVQATCAPIGCVPKHLNNAQGPNDDYYSNDKDFQNSPFYKK